jgi:hypothetical protein
MEDAFGGIRLVGGAIGGDVERLRLVEAACGGVGTLRSAVGAWDGTGVGAVDGTVGGVCVRSSKGARLVHLQHGQEVNVKGIRPL